MNEVFMAVRQGGCVGYFLTLGEIPVGWKFTATLDISDVMASMRCTKEQALKVMNSHWS